LPDPKKGVAYTFDVSLIDSSNRPAFKASPTIVAGDFEISVDGGAFAALDNTPTVVDEYLVEIVLSATEMNNDRIVVKCIDASGAEWDDVLISIDTTTSTIDDALLPTTIIESAGSYTVQQALSICLSVLAGVTSAGGATLKTPDGVSTRVAATLNASNERTAMTLTPSS